MQVVSLSFRLPYPPSVNKAFRNVPGRGRVKSKEYRAWAEEAAIRARIQIKQQRVSGPFRCEIVATKPDNRRRDLDNILKTTLDLLNAESIIDDDSQCQDLRIKWGGTEPGILITLDRAL